MRVNQRGLHAALKELCRVASPRAKLAHLSNILLHHRGGQLVLKATDLCVELTHVMPAEGDDLTACVPGHLLADLVAPTGRQSDAMVDLTVADDGGLAVLAEGIQSKVPGSNPADFPAGLAGASPSWKLAAEWPAPGLHDALGYVLVAASRDQTRMNLNSVLLDRQQAVATDGHRLHLARLPGALPKKILLHARAAAILHRLLPMADQVRIGVADNAVRFHVGAYLLDTRVLDEVFPTYRNVVPDHQSQGTRLRLDTQSLLQALRRIGRITAKDEMVVRVNGVLGLEVSSYEAGDARIELLPLDNTHRGEDLVVGFNPKYLTQAIAGAPETVELGLTDPLAPARIDRADGKIGIVMPLRV